jgi:hypothetical protein
MTRKRILAHATQNGTLVLDQQAIMLKATGSLPSLADAVKAGQLTSSDARAVRNDLNLQIAVFNKCQEREGEEPFRFDITDVSSDSQSISSVNESTSLTCPSKKGDHGWSTRNHAAFQANLLKQERTVIDIRLNPNRDMALGWDKKYGFFFCRDTCQKIMFPSEIVERKYFIM